MNEEWNGMDKHAIEDYHSPSSTLTNKGSKEYSSNKQTTTKRVQIMTEIFSLKKKEKRKILFNSRMCQNNDDDT